MLLEMLYEMVNVELETWSREERIAELTRFQEAMADMDNEAKEQFLSTWLEMVAG